MHRSVLYREVDDKDESKLTAKPPSTVVIGALAMTPPKNRVIMIVRRFDAVAVAAKKQMNKKMGRSTAIRQPYISENGPKTEDVILSEVEMVITVKRNMLVGPGTNPRMKSVRLRVTTSVETP